MDEKELNQQKKFTRTFCEIMDAAPTDLKEKWDGTVHWSEQQKDVVPQFTEGIVDSLPPELKARVDSLLSKYKAKQL